MTQVLFIGQSHIVAESRKKLAHLARQTGVSVSLIVPDQWHHASFGEYVFAPAPWDAGLTIYPMPIVQNGRAYAFAYSPLPFWRAVRATHPEIIQAEHEPGSLALAQVVLASRWCHAPVLAFTWENLIETQPRVRRWLENWQLPRLAHLFVGNQAAADIFRRRGYRGPLSVLPNVGVDAEHFTPHPEPVLRAELGLGQRFVIGFAGRMVPEKGVEDLLAAFAQLPENCHLLFVGSGPLQGALAQTAAAFGIAARVAFQPTVPHSQVNRYLNCMDCLVLPSRTLSGKWQEQFGLVLTQAMACGVPVVGSSSGAIPEVIAEAGLIFPEGNVASLIENLQHLVANPDLAVDLGQQGRQRVLTHYTHEQIARQTHEIHQRLMPPAKHADHGIAS